MIVMERFFRYQMNNPPARTPATSAAIMMTPVTPKPASATSIMVISALGFSGTTWTIVGVKGFS
jgi:hypothetical protein